MTGAAEGPQLNYMTVFHCETAALRKGREQTLLEIIFISTNICLKATEHRNDTFQVTGRHQGSCAAGLGAAPRIQWKLITETK